MIEDKQGTAHHYKKLGKTYVEYKPGNQSELEKSSSDVVANPDKEMGLNSASAAEDKEGETAIELPAKNEPKVTQPADLGAAESIEPALTTELERLMIINDLGREYDHYIQQTIEVKNKITEKVQLTVHQDALLIEVIENIHKMKYLEAKLEERKRKQIIIMNNLIIVEMGG